MSPSEDDFRQARGDLIKAVSVLTAPAMLENTLAARNVTYHAEELMRCLDDFYADREPDEARGPL